MSRSTRIELFCTLGRSCPVDIITQTLTSVTVRISSSDELQPLSGSLSQPLHGQPHVAPTQYAQNAVPFSAGYAHPLACVHRHPCRIKFVLRGRRGRCTHRSRRFLGGSDGTQTKPLLDGGGVLRFLGGSDGTQATPLLEGGGGPNKLTNKQNINGSQCGK